MSGITHKTTGLGTKITDAVWSENHDISFDAIAALPLIWSEGYVTKTWEDGQLWLTVTGVDTYYPAIRTGHSLQRKNVLVAQATLKVTNDESWLFIFFFEPRKGLFNDYQGMDTQGGSTHYARSRNAAAQTTTVLSNQNWLQEHTFKIRHYYDQSACKFYVDGAEVASHTTNISAQPYEICCGESDGKVRIINLKYPPGIKLAEAYDL